jgi:hypothetical protein
MYPIEMGANIIKLARRNKLYILFLFLYYYRCKHNRPNGFFVFNNQKTADLVLLYKVY